MIRFIGIDPGKKGAIVVLDEDSNFVARAKMPIFRGRNRRSEYDVRTAVALIQQILEGIRGGVVRATVERGQPLPSKLGGVVANFQRGYSLGLWEGILASLCVPYTLVTPRRWQAEMFRGVSAEDTKQASFLVASRLWPTVDWRRTERCKEPDDGLTDAALIAEYGRRILAPVSLDSGGGKT